MLHAGWRGLAGGVVAEGVAGAARARGRPGRSSAAIGPGAGPCCYEVGEEVHAIFAGRRDARRRARAQPRPQGDRRARELERAGVQRASTTSGCARSARPAVLLAPPRPRDHRPPGGGRVAELIHGLDARAACAPTSSGSAREIAGAGRDPARGRDPGGGQVRARARSSGCSPRPGSALLGENRAQDLVAKAEARPGAFTWDFIGHAPEPQGQADPSARPLHPLGRQRLGARAARAPRHAGDRGPGRGQRRRRGGQERGRRRPSCRRSSSAARCRVVGLMTMPPLTADRGGQPALVRGAAGARRAPRPALTCRWARARTTWRRSQEGATIVRLGTSLYARSAAS